MKIIILVYIKFVLKSCYFKRSLLKFKHMAIVSQLIAFGLSNSYSYFG
ncbi:hypothetical protein B11Cv2_000020 [Bartonella sp. 1-1C]|nr:hypothetical protein B11Cv2_000020 [Bartonella sp. 1-1C]